MACGAVVALLGVASPEDIAAFSVALFCGGVGYGGLALLRDAKRRTVAIRLFGAAYILRLCVTLLFYKSGAADMLGGGDDIIWQQSWQQSLYWVHGVSNPFMADSFIRSQTANSLADLYNGAVIPNTGYRFFATYFFYIINIPSQMALAVLNCFFNALTVVVIYQFAREFFSHRASQFAAIVALVLPGYLVWSAMTVKETWLILVEIVVMFTLWRMTRNGFNTQSWFQALVILFLIVLTQSLRFYVAWMMVPTVVLAYFCLRSPRPLRTLGLCVGGALGCYVFLSMLGILHFDLGGTLQKMLLAVANLRETISTKDTGMESAVRLNYDVTTAKGFILMFVTGVAYLLFAPFPWQFLTDASMRQLLVLPESLMWYSLIFIFIGPGLVECWRHHRQLLVGIILFVMPLILIYSLSFANIGLVYRQRAQLMPFFLLIIAAGHESISRRRSQRALHSKSGAQNYNYDYRYRRPSYGYYSSAPEPTPIARGVQ